MQDPGQTLGSSGNQRQECPRIVSTLFFSFQDPSLFSYPSSHLDYVTFPLESNLSLHAAAIDIPTWYFMKLKSLSIIHDVEFSFSDFNNSA